MKAATLMAIVMMAFPMPTLSNGDQAYYDRFDETYPEPANQRTLDDIASVAYFDSHFMGEYLDEHLVDLTNQDAKIAWSTSYLMMAYNLMYLATNDRRYAEAMAKTTKAVLEARDDNQGHELFWGVVAPVWSSSKYDDRGRAAYLVHTGIINYPMLQFALILRDNPSLAEELGVDPDDLVASCRESIEFHERQYVEGPGEYECYYIALNQEKSIEGQPLSANRLSALGRAFWFSSLYDDHPGHRERAIRLANFLKNRLLHNSETDSYIWPYNLGPADVGGSHRAEEIVAMIRAGEDISHGALTAAFFTDLAAENVLFTSHDMSRLGRTVTKGFARGDNARFFIHLGGDHNASVSPAHLRYTGRWLRLAPYDPEVYQRVEEFLLRNAPEPYPLDVAALFYYRRFRPDGD